MPERRGLNPEDYDASRWPARLQQIAKIAATHEDTSAPRADDTIGQFDAAMSVCVMRYISDLRIGFGEPIALSTSTSTSRTRRVRSRAAPLFLR